MLRSLLATVGLVFTLSSPAAAEDIKPGTSVTSYPMLPQSSEPITDLPIVGQPQLSPDGAYIAYLTVQNGRHYLVINDRLNAAAPTVVPPIEDTDMLWVRWANDQRLLFAIGFEGKRRFETTYETRLIAIDHDGGNARLLVSPERVPGAFTNKGANFFFTTPLYYPTPRVQSDIADILPHEPHQILVNVDRDGDGDRELRKIDIRTGDFETLVPERQGIQLWHVDQQGNPRFGQGVDGMQEVARYRAADGKWKRASKAEWYRDGLRLVGFSDDPNIAYVHGPGTRAPSELIKVDFTRTTMLESLERSTAPDIQEFVLHPATHRAVGVLWSDQRGDYAIFDEEVAHLYRDLEATFPDARNGIVSATADLGLVVITQQGSGGQSGDYHIWDRSRDTAEPFGRAMPNRRSPATSS